MSWREQECHRKLNIRKALSAQSNGGASHSALLDFYTVVRKRKDLPRSSWQVPHSCRCTEQASPPLPERDYPCRGRARRVDALGPNWQHGSRRHVGKNNGLTTDEPCRQITRLSDIERARQNRQVERVVRDNWRGFARWRGEVGRVVRKLVHISFLIARGVLSFRPFKEAQFADRCSTHLSGESNAGSDSSVDQVKMAASDRSLAIVSGPKAAAIRRT